MAKVKHQVGIAGTITSLYNNLTTNEGLSAWWATSASGTTAVGSEIQLEFLNLAVLCFQYQQLDDNKKVSLKCVSCPGSWQDSTLVFELYQEDDQVFVTLTHQNEKSTEEDFLYFSTKWAIYLMSLKDLVETGKGRPYPLDTKIHHGD